jgi:hypothetical protein
MQPGDLTRVSRRLPPQSAADLAGPDQLIPSHRDGRCSLGAWMNALACADRFPRHPGDFRTSKSGLLNRYRLRDTAAK